MECGRLRCSRGPPMALEPRNKIVFLNILALSRLPRLPQRSCREVRSVVLRASYADASRHDLGVVLTISSVPPSSPSWRAQSSQTGQVSRGNQVSLDKVVQGGFESV